MRRLQDLGVEMERDPRVVSVSIFAGFPHADIPDAGLGVYVVTDGDRALAERLADELAQTAWDHRREFVHRGLPVQDAVARALAAEGRPIVLADMADNTGGGAAGDGTEILRELLRVGARSAVVACLWDPEAVAACVQAGVGSRVTLAVGGKVDDRHGAPLTVTGTVRTPSDGRFVHKGPMLRGLPGRLGPTAVLEVDGVRVFARDPALRVHVYGKQVRPGRKVGHVTAYGDDLDDVRERARHAAAWLRGDLPEDQ